MEPISAFALACNVVQVVELSLKVAKACREIYQQGSISKHNDIFTVADELSSADTDLIDQITKSKFSPRQARLKKLAQESQSTANELLAVLNELKFYRRHGHGRALVHAIKTLAKRRPIERLEQKLKDQDHLLNSVILKELYQRCESHDILQSAAFERLKQIQKDLIQQHFELQARLNDNHTAVAKQNMLVESRIVSQIQGLELNIHCDRAYENLAESFRFPEMVSRQTMIQERIPDYGDTYSWLFRPPPLETARLDPGFFAWLQAQEHQGSGCFWITGKPGSGKSSLMNFIYEKLQAGELGDKVLQGWAPAEHRLVLCHFFFQPGLADLQKSFEGYLRTMCHQLLSAEPRLRSIISEDPCAPEPIKLRMSRSSLPVPWLLKDIQQCFEYLLSKAVHSKIIFMIVDGLDELVGDQERAAVYLQTLDDVFPNLKICCSSRPELHFRDIFRTTAFLELQHFNRNDMISHCRSQLGTTRAAKLATEIVNKAEGVFLWLYLVVAHLRQASRYADEDELQQLIHECPGDMFALFSHMLQKAVPRFGKKTTSYLALAYIYPELTHFKEQGPSTSVLIIADKFDHDLDHGVLFRRKVDRSLAKRILETCATGAERVIALSCGLLESDTSPLNDWRHVYLEAVEQVEDQDERIAGCHVISALTKWNFMHNSVDDFLQASRQSDNVLELFPTSDLDLRTKIFRAHLAMLKLIVLLTPSAIGRVLMQRQVYVREAWKLAHYLELEVGDLIDLGIDMSTMTTIIDMVIETVGTDMRQLLNKTRNLHPTTKELPSIEEGVAIEMVVLRLWFPDGPSLETQLCTMFARVPALMSYVQEKIHDAPSNHRSKLFFMAFVELFFERCPQDSEQAGIAFKDPLVVAMQYLEQGVRIKDPICVAATSVTVPFLSYSRIETTGQDIILAHILRRWYWLPETTPGTRSSVRRQDAKIIQWLIAQGADDNIKIRIGLTFSNSHVQDNGWTLVMFKGFLMASSTTNAHAHDAFDCTWMEVDFLIPSLARFSDTMSAHPTVWDLSDVLELHVVTISPWGTHRRFEPLVDEQRTLAQLLVEPFKLASDTADMFTWPVYCGKLGDCVAAIMQAHVHDFSIDELKSFEQR